jgi:uncharacterized protein YjiS (DUF1127 family)
MCNPASYRSLLPAVRRTASGAIDTEHYRHRARIERAAFLRAVLDAIARCATAPRRCLRAWLETRARHRELAALSTRELKDIGLTSADLGAVARGAFQQDPTRRQRATGTDS